jgi:PAS domain S-box-containing protein
VSLRLNPRLDTAPCGYVTVADDGTMTDVNATLATILGYSAVELEGWHLQKILGPGGRIFYQTHVFPLLKLHGVAEELYMPLRTRDGADLPMLVNATRRERDGTVANDFVFVRMIQRHEFEDQLVTARRLAEEANSAKARFLSMMSHDLRTPLTAIAGNAQLMAMEALGPVTGEQREAIGSIKNGCDELLRMIDDILAFAQLDAGPVRVRTDVVPLPEAIARAEALVRVQMQEAGITFERPGAGDGPVVRADPDRLQQILLNLLTNAVKFTPRGGRVSVTTDEEHDRVRIHVRDTGIGIADDQLSRIFEPFVQLGEGPGRLTQTGVGLGLAISRDLARAMNGDVTVTSTVGKGSMFTIDLPAESPVAAAELQD